MSSECTICCSNFTKTKRHEVECPKCQFVCCSQCVKTYISGQVSDPHCMKCNVEYEREFIHKHLGITFMKTTYKTIKLNLLFELEKSRIPETMSAVHAYKEASALKDDIRMLNTARKELLEQLEENAKNLRAVGNRVWDLEHGDYTSGSEKKSRFSHPCLVEECKGFMSSQWKCGLCNMFACSKCHEILGPTKPHDHVCDEEAMKTIALIKKETKMCPKCSISIYKVSGCDQMWCTQCQVAFSWKSGEIQRGGTIHNPHFYEAQRRTGIIMRNPGDVVCGGVVQYYHLRDTIRNISCISVNVSKGYGAFTLLKTDNEKMLHYVCSILHRSIGHNNYTLDNFRRNIRNLETTVMDRVKFLVGELSEDQFQKTIYSKNQKIIKTRKMCNIMETYVHVATENINEIYNIIREKQWNGTNICTMYEKIWECFNRHDKILSYTVNEFLNVAIEYNQGTYVLPRNTTTNTHGLEFMYRKPGMSNSAMREYVKEYHSHIIFK